VELSSLEILSNFISHVSESASEICQFLNSSLTFGSQGCQKNLVCSLVVIQKMHLVKTSSQQIKLKSGGFWKESLKL
jgi:hypothetical protein